MEYNFFATSSKPSMGHSEVRKFGENGPDLSLTLRPPAKSCTSCGKTKTPMWRNGPDGPKTLCNACGLRYSREKMRMGSVLTLAPPTPTVQANVHPN